MEHTSLSHNKDYLLCKNPIAEGFFFSSHREKGVLVWVVFFFCFERVSGIGRPNMGRSPVFFVCRENILNILMLMIFHLKISRECFF